MQSELLAAFFKDELSTTCLFAGGGGPDANVASEQQPPALAGRIPLVGGTKLQMEPTKELSDEDSSLAHSSLSLDTDFCDSLLNSVSEVDGNPYNTEAMCFDSYNVEHVMPDFNSLDLDCLDLECFLSVPVPLAC